MAPVHRGQVGNEEEDVGRSSFKVDPEYTRSPESCCFALLCFNCTEDESFEQNSDTISCVSQEDYSSGAEVQLGEMRNMGNKDSYCNSSDNGWQGQISEIEEVMAGPWRSTG